jgi:hypothetical protein
VSVDAGALTGGIRVSDVLKAVVRSVALIVVAVAGPARGEGDAVIQANRIRVLRTR